MSALFFSHIKLLQLENKSVHELLVSPQSQHVVHPGEKSHENHPKRFSNIWSQGRRAPTGPRRAVAGVQASYSGVTLPSFHSIRISPRCNAGEEWGRRMACSVSGALSLGAGEPGTLASGLGVYDFRTHTTFLLLEHRDKKTQAHFWFPHIMCRTIEVQLGLNLV